MIRKVLLYSLLMILVSNFALAQEVPAKEKDSLKTEQSAKEIKKSKRDEKKDEKAQDTLSLNFEDIDPNSPARAAFYSAILPGLGQAYNKAYWKIPIVYGALGTSLYFYFTNNDDYNRYRDALKRRLAGFNDDEFQGIIFDQRTLERAQREFRRNRDLSLVVTIGLYVLNIVEANVHAHLKQFNVRENLSVKPHYFFDPAQSGQSNLGLTVNFKF